MIGRKQTTDVISEIQTANTVTKDPQIIAETFNDFFSSIGPKIANSVPKMEKDPLTDIPDPNPNLEFDIGSIGPVHIIDILKSMQPKPSTDIFGISIKLLCVMLCTKSMYRCLIFLILAYLLATFPKNLNSVELSQFTKLAIKAMSTIIGPFPLSAHSQKYLKKWYQLT